jgi:pSer/pThr/pTyr-binding forkhead associated (FHA) protein
MPALLVSLTPGPGILVDKPIVLIGRDEECDVQIESAKVSRRHCIIAQVADYLVVRDLGSTNGVRVNGVRVQEGRLRAGDELVIGNQRYKVRWETNLARPSPKAPAAPRAEDQPAPNYDEEDLESFDDPVALPDPDPHARRPVRQAPVVRQSDKPSSIMLPEEPGLPPIGDALPGSSAS